MSDSCDTKDYSPPGSTVHGNSRQEYWSGLPFPSPKVQMPPCDQMPPCLFIIKSWQERNIKQNVWWIVSILSRWLSGKESACQWRRHKRWEFDPWVRKMPWSRKWQPSCSSTLAWKNSMDRRGWWATVHGVSESEITEWLSTHTSEPACNGGNMDSVPGLGRSPGEGNGNPL